MAMEVVDRGLKFSVIGESGVLSTTRVLLVVVVLLFVGLD